MNVIEALEWGQERLSSVSETPRLDVEILLGYVFGRGRAYIYTWPESELCAARFAQYRDLVERRWAGEPVAYLTETKEFWSLTLKVNEHTLIPRPETETLVEHVLERLSAGSCKVIDLGTGSGAVALALATERPGWDIVATDVSTQALAVARANAMNLGLHGINFVPGSWFEPVSGQMFDAVISNPPYIVEGDPHLAEVGVCFEPKGALVASDNGYSALFSISEQARGYLRTGGVLALEHGSMQGERLRVYLERQGYKDVETCRDLAGQERVTIARWAQGQA